MKKLTLEDLKEFKGFDEIDKKVNYIEENRSICEYSIRELNHAIDLDYVKQSEMIEDNCEHELSDFIVDEKAKIYYSEPPVPWNRLRNITDKEDYYSLMREQREKSSIVIYKTNQDGTEEVKEFNNSGHLIALGYALGQARSDRRLLKAGGKPELESDFIEYVNEKLISNLLAGGPTAGYGRYRSRVYRYGAFSEINVRVAGAKFTTTPGAEVYDAMQELVKEYNESTLHPVLKAIVFKTKFIKIHPFCDFNGRTSRILLNYMLVRYGFPTVTIKGRQRQRYLDAMETAIVEGDYAPMVSIVKKLLDERCNKYMAIIEEFKQGKNSDCDFDL